MLIRSPPAMRHVQVHDPLPAEFLGGLAAQLAAIPVGEQPLVSGRVIHHVHIFPPHEFWLHNGSDYTPTPAPSSPPAGPPRRSRGGRPRATTPTPPPRGPD